MARSAKAYGSVNRLRGRRQRLDPPALRLSGEVARRPPPAPLSSSSPLCSSRPACRPSPGHIVIVNNDGPASASTIRPATPVGGNPGTTVGQQRLIAFQYAATVWGATARSARCRSTSDASFTPLDCTADSAVLGSAGPTTSCTTSPTRRRPTPGITIALANKLRRRRPAPENGLATTSSPTSTPTSARPTASPARLVLRPRRQRAATNTDLVTVLLHEFGHGLGFSELRQRGQRRAAGRPPRTSTPVHVATPHSARPGRR